MNQFLLHFVLVIALLSSISGNLKGTFERCCELGSNWGKEGLDCSKFPAPVAGVLPEQQSVCLSSVEICCLRTHREQQCTAGMDAARSGKACSSSTGSSVEFNKDCCEACKIGLIAGSTGIDCNEEIKLGPPWDQAYKSCCMETSAKTDTSTTTLIATKITTTTPAPPPLESLCDLMPGVLCAHICVPVPGSYRCECYPGFKLMFDGISCSQLDIPDRCEEANPCDHKCIDTGVAIQCRCNKGYELVADKRTCVDIDECEQGLANCDILLETCVNTKGGYICINKDQNAPDNDAPNILETAEKCPPGYQFNFDLQLCIDIDECAEGTDDCNRESQFCLNTRGNFTCQNKASKTTCPAGFKMNSSLGSCEDIDECENKDLCLNHEECVNEPGGYRCDLKTSTAKYFPSVLISSTQSPTIVQTIKITQQSTETPHSIQPISVEQTTASPIVLTTTEPNCPNGLRLDKYQRICSDIDECKERTHSCDSNQDCYNAVGSFECRCKNGFQLDYITGACIDINECQTNRHDCTSSQRCDNTIGSFHCIRYTSCGTGYTLNAATGNCEDDDECVLQTHNCDVLGPNWQCRNTVGSFRCERRRIVSARPILVNTSRQTIYLLNPTRSTSYYPEKPSQTPVQYYPPTSPTRQTTVTSTVPTHQSQPTVLYKISTLENRNPPKNKEETSISFTHPASPLKKICLQGFERNQNDQCVDINECERGNVCAPMEKCVNLEGSYECVIKQCSFGFQLSDDRSHCKDIDECETQQHTCRKNQMCENFSGSFQCVDLRHCGAGYTLNEDGTFCNDINECELGTHSCGQGQICSNRPGGYMCQCQQGHSYNRNNQCEDINECERFRGQICSANSECQNTIGSYRCICKEGFKRKTETLCEDINECDIPGICQHSCHNLWGSYRCSCKSGFLINKDNRSCSDRDECEDFKDHNLCVGICTNTQGSYVCRCPEGYRLGTDGRTCQDIDECLSATACAPGQVCFNTRGSFRCNEIVCPQGFINDAKQKNQCKRIAEHCTDEICARTPSTISYNYITFISYLPIPSTGSIDIFTMRGPRWTSFTVRFKMDIEEPRAPPRVKKATKDCFRMRQTNLNQAVISLQKTIEGPQEIQLTLTMDLYWDNIYQHSAVANLLVVVSQYEF